MDYSFVPTILYLNNFCIPKLCNPSKRLFLTKHIPEIQMGHRCAWKTFLDSSQILKFFVCKFTKIFRNISRFQGCHYFTARSAKRLLRTLKLWNGLWNLGPNRSRVTLKFQSYFSWEQFENRIFSKDTAKEIVNCPSFKNLKVFRLCILSESFDFQIFVKAMKVWIW